MPTRTRAVMAALTLLATAGLTLTACSRSSPHATDPTTVPTTTAPATPGRAALIEACVAAITAGKDDAVGGAPECDSLPTADYYEAIHEANEAALKAFDDATDAGASATP